MSATAQKSGGESRVLPQLREDISISEGSTSADGAQTWLIYDPVRHRYSQIDQTTFAILCAWNSHQTSEALAAAASSKLNAEVASRDIDALAGFLEASHLVTDGRSQNWQSLCNASAQQKQAGIKALLHNYLFFKVPLFDPQRALDRSKRFFSPIYSSRVLAAVCAAGVAGLYLVVRQWDEFLGDAASLAAPGGLARVAVALFCIKCLHELGHAVTAAQYGCRVPSIGIAFMLMAPVMYTDVTDAWRLRHRRQRMAIDLAGVAIELGLACLATFVWAFLPEGPGRQTAFLVATTSWLMSLAINLNPLMRFDGYYVLSDYLRIENLQDRSFALANWHLREVLFAVNRPRPEFLPGRLHTFLIGYAYCVWIYRLVLYTTIALVVYAFFFKVLGLLLFAVEIIYFIARPLWVELKVWWAIRHEILQRQRWRVLAVVLGSLILLALYPWNSTIRMSAILQSAKISHIYPPRAAEIETLSVSRGAAVQEGDLLLTLRSSELDFALRMATARLKSLKIQFARSVADQRDLENRATLEQQLQAELERMSGLQLEKKRLEVRAPHGGFIFELNPDIKSGQWLSSHTAVATIAEKVATHAVGYVGEGEVDRIAVGARGRFISEMPFGPEVEIELKHISTAKAPDIALLALTTAHGGSVATSDNGQSERPQSKLSQFQITFNVVDGKPPVTEQLLRGIVVLAATPESFLAALFRSVMSVVIRESGV